MTKEEADARQQVREMVAGWRRQHPERIVKILARRQQHQYKRYTRQAFYKYVVKELGKVANAA